MTCFVFWGHGEQLVPKWHRSGHQLWLRNLLPLAFTCWKASSPRWKLQHTPLSLGKRTSLFEVILEVFQNCKFGDRSHPYPQERSNQHISKLDRKFPGASHSSPRWVLGQIPSHVPCRSHRIDPWHVWHTMEPWTLATGMIGTTGTNRKTHGFGIFCHIFNVWVIGCGLKLRYLANAAWVNTIDLDTWSMEMCECPGCRSYVEIFSAHSSARLCKVSMSDPTSFKSLRRHSFLHEIFTTLVIGCVIIGHSVLQWGFHRFRIVSHESGFPNHRRMIHFEISPKLETTGFGKVLQSFHIFSCLQLEYV